MSSVKANVVLHTVLDVIGEICYNLHSFSYEIQKFANPCIYLYNTYTYTITVFFFHSLLICMKIYDISCINRLKCNFCNTYNKRLALLKVFHFIFFAAIANVRDFIWNSRNLNASQEKLDNEACSRRNTFIQVTR